MRLNQSHIPRDQGKRRWKTEDKIRRSEYEWVNMGMLNYKGKKLKTQWMFEELV